MDHAHADTRALELVSQRFRKATHRKLARRIRYLLRRRDDAVDARKIHHTSIFTRSQQRQESARHAYYTPEVDLEEPLEILVGNLLERAAHCNAGNVDEH